MTALVDRQDVTEAGQVGSHRLHAGLSPTAGETVREDEGDPCFDRAVDRERAGTQPALMDSPSIVSSATSVGEKPGGGGSSTKSEVLWVNAMPTLWSTPPQSCPAPGR